ncbi:MAG: aminotransferase class V-fold PLP-dependent enzyme [Terriglobales bacterium]|jgi:aspartate aminotransferase-like enzyme
MLKKNRLFTPGPTPLLPAAQSAMSAANMHHRTADFKALYAKTLAGLKTFIGTNHDVLLLASSGTGAMEASVANLTKLGDRVLVLTAGKFGERWSDLVATYGCRTEVVSAPYGEAIDLNVVREKLVTAADGLRCIYMQATESSTGVRHDVEGVARLVGEANSRGGDILLIVDAITGLGTTRFDVDVWGIDIIIGGSQKALMIPPGLAYLAASERAWKRMEAPHSPAYYFNLRKERKSAAKGESAFTPAIALVAALSAALDFIATSAGGDLALGRDLLIHNAEVAAAMTRAAAQALGLKLYAASPAEALTAIASPHGIDSGVIVKEFRQRFDAVVANGQGEMKGKLFRIAHLGYYDYLDTIGIIGALEQVMAGIMQPKSFEFGAALKAAQDEYAKACPQ